MFLLCLTHFFDPLRPIFRPCSTHESDLLHPKFNPVRTIACPCWTPKLTLCDPWFDSVPLMIYLTEVQPSQDRDKKTGIVRLLWSCHESSSSAEFMDVLFGIIKELSMGIMNIMNMHRKLRSWKQLKDAPRLFARTLPYPFPIRSSS